MQRSSGVFSAVQAVRTSDQIRHIQNETERRELTCSVEHEDHVLAEGLTRSQSLHQDDENSIPSLGFARVARSFVVGRDERGHHELLIQGDLKEREKGSKSIESARDKIREERRDMHDEFDERVVERFVVEVPRALNELEQAVHGLVVEELCIFEVRGRFLAGREERGIDEPRSGISRRWILQTSKMRSDAGSRSFSSIVCSDAARCGRWKNVICERRSEDEAEETNDGLTSSHSTSSVRIIPGSSLLHLAKLR